MRSRPALIPPVVAFFLFQFGYMVYYTFILIEMQRRYGFTTAEIGLFSMVIGGGFVLGTLFGYKTAKQLLGSDMPVAIVGLAVCGILVGLAALPLPAWAQVVLTLVIATSNILAFVTLLAAIASAVAETEQGWALGVGNASVALSVFAAGLLSSLLSIVPSGAFQILGGLLILSAIVPTRRLTSTTGKKAVAT
jgi:predicted MFS family arabinose efflux permease